MICEENLPIPSVDESEYKDINGCIFKSNELTKLSPNAFAIAFLRKKFGDRFHEIILDPGCPTDNTIVSSEVINELKEALNSNFHAFMFSKVRKSVNQAARDGRNKLRRLSLKNENDES